MSKPIGCYEIADEIDFQGEHCPTCHGNNIFDDDVCTDVALADGRTAEVCCDVRKALKDAGMIALTAGTGSPPSRP